MFRLRIPVNTTGRSRPLLTGVATLGGGACRETQASPALIRATPKIAAYWRCVLREAFAPLVCREP